MVMSVCDSECNSSQWQAVVTSGSHLVYSWFVDSQLIAVTTKNQVINRLIIRLINRLVSVYLLCNAEYFVVCCAPCNMFVFTSTL